MDIPYRDEIREVRAKARRSEVAADLVRRARLIETELQVLRRQAELAPELPVATPGEPVIEEAIEAFPHLDALRQAAPDPAATGLARLTARVQQMRSLIQLLEPVASEYREHQHSLHHLSKAQGEALMAPEHDGHRAALQSHRREHAEASHTLQGLLLQRQVLEPLRILLSTLIPQARDLLAPPNPTLGARTMTATLCEQVAVLIEDTTLSLDLPDPSEVTDAPSTIEAALARLDRTLAAVDQEAQRLDALVEAARARADEHEGWLREHLG